MTFPMDHTKTSEIFACDHTDHFILIVDDDEMPETKTAKHGKDSWKSRSLGIQKNSNDYFLDRCLTWETV